LGSSVVKSLDGNGVGSWGSGDIYAGQVEDCTAQLDGCGSICWDSCIGSGWCYWRGTAGFEITPSQTLVSGDGLIFAQVVKVDSAKADKGL
jgi:hypothetical protein